MAKFRSNNTWEQQRFYNEAHEMMRQQEAERTSGGDVAAKVVAWIAMGVFLLGLCRQDMALAFGGMFGVIILGIILLSWISISMNNKK